jgi:putative spermidine/putrescine transport system substrate-binding protein
VTHKAAADLVDPAVLPDMPTAPDNLAAGVSIDADYWVANVERLTERFNNWVAQ